MQKHIMLDIEALGLRAGSAITEIGAVEFYPETGRVGASFSAFILPQAPLVAELETLEWHREKGTWPPGPSEVRETLSQALGRFDRWYRELGEVEAVWAWGATYDFPLLAHALETQGMKTPWKYYDARCARTVWQVAFGERKHAPRPHRALADATASAVDVMAAMNALGVGEDEDEGALEWSAVPEDLAAHCDGCDENDRLRTELGGLGQNLIAEIVKQGMFAVRHPDPDEAHVFVWAGNADEQLECAVAKFLSSNVELIHGDPDGSNKLAASSPLDGASCSASSSS